MPDTSLKQINPTVKGLKSTLIGIAANFLLAIIKGITGFLGNSYALIADAIESLSDVFSSIIIYSGLKIASKPPDLNHPYGHGKAEPIAAFLVAIALIGAAILISIQSLSEILLPQEAPEAYTLYVLVGVILIKESLFRFVNNVGSMISSTAVKVDAWHHRSDAITSVAAFIGISIALIGGEGYESADDYAALFASVIIVYNAYRLLKPAVRDLMDFSPPREIEYSIRKKALSVEGVQGLDKCKIRKMGFEFYVDLDVIVDGERSVREGHKIAHTVKEEIMNSFPAVANVLIHIEPDDPERLKRKID